tara:strand:+ start:3015 stop:3677 length:663 start_codon:yes stop_codon:yes gene_type:complete
MILDTLKKDFLLFYRNKTSILLPLLFFFLIVSIFPLVLGPDVNLLMKIMPGIIWIISILTTLLSSHNFFYDDLDSGILDLYLTSKVPLSSMFFSKIISCWVVTFVPLLIFLPIISIMYSLDAFVLMILLITLFVGTPTLIGIGLFGSLLIISLPRNNILLPIIILPFYIPVLVFAADSISIASSMHIISPQLYILVALLVLALAFLPYLMSLTLKITINN